LIPENSIDVLISPGFAEENINELDNLGKALKNAIKYVKDHEKEIADYCDSLHAKDLLYPSKA